MPNYDITSNVTGTKLAAMAPDSVRKLWNEGFLKYEQTTDFFSKMEGTGPTALVRIKDDPSKGRGQKMTFTVMSGFYDEPHIDEEMFHTPDDFEDVQISDFDMTVGWARHAVRNLEITEEVMGMRGEIASGFNVEQGKWIGRYKSEQIFQLLMLKMNAENIFYAGGKTEDTLTSADALAWDEITALGQVIKPLGGLAADIRGANSTAPVWSNVVIPTEAAMNSLKLDPDYKLSNQNAGIRGDGNTIFSGVVRDIDGHVLHVYDPKDHDGIGAIGSPLNPKAQLGIAIAAAVNGNETLAIRGGGFSTTVGNVDSPGMLKKRFTKYFAGFNYKFLGIGAHTSTTQEKYLLIVNPKNATVDPGKVGMYAYTTGNDGNKITITKRLASAALGAFAFNTVGSVVWNTGVWAGKHTAVHPQGAMIIPCNAKGQPVGDTPMLLRSGILRGYGKHRGHRSQAEHEGGFAMDKFVTTVFGQVLAEDRLGRQPGVCRLRHALNYPELGLPIVV